MYRHSFNRRHWCMHAPCRPRQRQRKRKRKKKKRRHSLIRVDVGRHGDTATWAGRTGHQPRRLDLGRPERHTDTQTPRQHERPRARERERGSGRREEWQASKRATRRRALVDRAPPRLVSAWTAGRGTSGRVRAPGGATTTGATVSSAARPRGVMAATTYLRRPRPSGWRRAHHARPQRSPETGVTRCAGQRRRERERARTAKQRRAGSERQTDGGEARGDALRDAPPPRPVAAVTESGQRYGVQYCTVAPSPRRIGLRAQGTALLRRRDRHDIHAPPPRAAAVRFRHDTREEPGAQRAPSAETRARPGSGRPRAGAAPA